MRRPLQPPSAHQVVQVGQALGGHGANHGVHDEFEAEDEPEFVAALEPVAALEDLEALHRESEACLAARLAAGALVQSEKVTDGLGTPEDLVVAQECLEEWLADVRRAEREVTAHLQGLEVAVVSAKSIELSGRGPLREPGQSAGREAAHCRRGIPSLPILAGLPIPRPRRPQSPPW